MAGQLVVRRGQLLPLGAELGGAHPALQMLDAHADGEFFLLHGHPRLVQHPEGIPGGVARGQDQGVAVHVIGPPLRHHRDAGELPPVAAQSPQLALKAHLAPQRQDLPPHGSHHLPQHIGADVGLVGPEDVPGCAVFCKGIEHKILPGVAGTGGQLSVGEGPRAPLAKLHVRGAGQLSRATKMLHILCAFLHRTAPLQHNGLQPHAGQGQGGEQAAGAHAHHHRGQGGASPGAGQLIRPALHPIHMFSWGGPHHRRFVGQGQPHRIDIVQLVFPAGVDGLPQQFQLAHLAGTDAQLSGRSFFQLFQIPIHRQGKVAHSDHGVLRRRKFCFILS